MWSCQCCKLLLFETESESTVSPKHLIEKGTAYIWTVIASEHKTVSWRMDDTIDNGAYRYQILRWRSNFSISHAKNKSHTYRKRSKQLRPECAQYVRKKNDSKRAHYNGRLYPCSSSDCPQEKDQEPRAGWWKYELPLKTRKA